MTQMTQMTWRLIVRFKADEAGALQACQAVKDLLEPEHGLVGTTTVAEWLWENHEHVPHPPTPRATEADVDDWIHQLRDDLAMPRDQDVERRRRRRARADA